MRVLFILPSLRVGGAERVFVTLLRHLDRALFEPHLALLEKSGPFLTEVPADVPIHDLKQSRVRYAFPRIIRLAWRLRPAAIVSTLRELNLAMIMAKPFLPPEAKLLVRETTTPSAYFGQVSRHPKTWEWLYRRLYKRADKIICGADFVLSDLAEHFNVPRSKLVRIYNPLDIEGLERQAGAGANPYAGPGPQILAVGRLSREKGYDVLLAAMSRVRERIPSAQLTLLGEGPLRKGLEAERDRLGLGYCVSFAGVRLNPYPYLKHADLFVLSSRFEGMPNALLEALALGTAIVAVDCPGGVREALPAGLISWLVPRLNPQLLGEAIIKACNSGPKKSMPVGDLGEALNQFKVERIARAYGDLFLA
jgi:glycosyltransferase involved in cell wall biosynthesis